MDEQNNPQLSHTQQQPVMTPTPDPHSNMFRIVLFGIVMLGIGLGGGYLLFSNNSEQVSSQKQSKDTQVSPAAMEQILSPTVTQAAYWKTYNDTKSNITFLYPKEWDYKVFAGNEDIGFKPIGETIPDGVEIQIPVDVQINKENYTNTVQRLADIYGTKNKEDFTVGDLVGVHIWGTVTEPGPAQGLSGGSFVLNNNGKSISFSYNVIKGINYMNEARQMSQSVNVSN